MSPYAIAIVSAIPLLVVLSRHQEEVRAVLAGVFVLLQAPFRILYGHVQQAVVWLVLQIRAAFADDTRPATDSPSEPPTQTDRAEQIAQGDESAQTDRAQGQADAVPARRRDWRRWAGWLVIGAIFNTATFLLFSYTDLWLAALTFQAWGFGGGEIALPASADILAALSLVGVGIFWGLVLLDLFGITHVGPWESLSARHRKYFKILGVSMLALVVLIATSMAAWRGLQLASPIATLATVASSGGIIGSPTGPVAQGNRGATATTEPVLSGENLGLSPAVVGSLLAGVVATSAAFAGWGALAAFKYLYGFALIVPVLVLGALAVGLNIMATLMDHIYSLVNAVLSFLASLGTLVRGALTTFYNWILRLGNLKEILHLKSIEPTPPPPSNPAQPQLHPGRPPAAPDQPPAVPPRQPAPTASAPTDGARSADDAHAWNPFGF